MSPLKFYTIASLAAYGIAWALGIYLALIGFRGNPTECTSDCLVVLVLGGLAWLLVLVFGHSAFGLFMKSGIESPERAESLEIGNTEDDQRILQILRERLSSRRVARRLRNVDTVVWSDTQRWEMPRFKWQGYRKPSVFVISSGLRDRLDVGDWRIYLSWHYMKLSTSQKVRALQPGARAILPILLFFAGAGTLSFSLGQYASALFGSIFGPPVLLLFGYRLGPMMKRTLLRLDIVAAESLNGMKLLSLFRKIDGLQLQENENAKARSGWVARLWPEPSIAERIANLL